MEIITYLEARTKAVIKNLHHSSLKEWSFEEIKEIVSTILEVEDITYRMTTPIVKIIKRYGIYTCKEGLKENTAASIFVNGSTKEIYGNDKVITVNKGKDLWWQRYFAAIELGKYIFNFLSSNEYQSDSFFCHCYEYGNYNDIAEAQKFAFEILMPESSFLRQYLVAINNYGDTIYAKIYLCHFFEVPEELITIRMKQILDTR